MWLPLTQKSSLFFFYLILFFVGILFQKKKFRFVFSFLCFCQKLNILLYALAPNIVHILFNDLWKIAVEWIESHFGCHRTLIENRTANAHATYALRAHHSLYLVHSQPIDKSWIESFVHRIVVHLVFSSVCRVVRIALSIVCTYLVRYDEHVNYSCRFSNRFNAPANNNSRANKWE